MGAGTEVNLIEVALQDLFLAEVLLNLLGQEGFLYFALVTSLLGKVELSSQLHGDGAGPLLDSSGPIISQGCPSNAPVVNALVLIEASVFNGDDGLSNVFSEIFKLHRFVVFSKESRHQFAVGTQDSGDFTFLASAQLRHGRERLFDIPPDGIQQPGGAGSQGQNNQGQGTQQDSPE